MFFYRSSLNHRSAIARPRARCSLVRCSSAWSSAWCAAAAARCLFLLVGCWALLASSCFAQPTSWRAARARAQGGRRRQGGLLLCGRPHHCSKKQMIYIEKQAIKNLPGAADARWVRIVGCARAKNTTATYYYYEDSSTRTQSLCRAPSANAQPSTVLTVVLVLATTWYFEQASQAQ